MKWRRCQWKEIQTVVCFNLKGTREARKQWDNNEKNLQKRAEEHSRVRVLMTWILAWSYEVRSGELNMSNLIWYLTGYIQRSLKDDTKKVSFTFIAHNRSPFCPYDQHKFTNYFSCMKKKETYLICTSRRIAWNKSLR